MNNFWITAIGFLAQALFSARLIVQWFKSEKAGRVLSPTIFWQLSLVASFLLVVYGVLRNDIVVIGGQLISYFIYIRNLRFKRAWRFLPIWFRMATIFAPIISLAYLILNKQFHFHQLLENDDISYSLMVWGSIGQIIFTFRFIYQWIYSERQQQSVLPAGFWVISLVGSLMIISYGVFRSDIVIIIGQLFGSIIYSRNLFLIFKKKKTQ
ncbi:lipid-A-disaccharide synthase N-terminal domain-containing protein [Fulvivirga ligni]|uniref:lipid-A-disaccharide synthase N-terminal domain-containing protein n=1 Tax=Fulvivirga ligni TaxID=2904246 RepID=UPI001F19E101|nr:lipid-A-disaccharide synthase N-terminal domain-containing protein [Fulvivirga ligni]UII22349.1 lipid-A-disaccharide synthase N-terminal domain-containing protein [Fulvivirga ligni]